MLIKTSNKTQISEYEFRRANSNTSFPSVLTDDVLAEFGYAVVHYPEHPAPVVGLKTVVADVVLVDGLWTAQYSQIPLIADELAAIENSVRQQRNEKLSGSDWTQVADAPVNKAEWEAYRQALREIPKQAGFPLRIQWPQVPA